MNLTHRLIQSHLVSGTLVPGEEIALRIDQTLSQDATGTLSYLQFEAIGVPRVHTQLSVSYVDHNMLQGDFRNADDHVYLQDVAAKYGLYYSRPGNGICHQVHLERFAVPGTTLLGTDKPYADVRRHGRAGARGRGAGRSHCYGRQSLLPAHAQGAGGGAARSPATGCDGQGHYF